MSLQLSICTEFINGEKEAPGSGKIRVRVRCMAYLFLCLAVWTHALDLCVRREEPRGKKILRSCFHKGLFKKCRPRQCYFGVIVTTYSSQ